MSKKTQINDDEIAISVNNVSKYFPPARTSGSLKNSFVSLFRKKEKVDDGYWALENINFEIKKGDFFGIVGRNGSGKSTLLKIMAGVYYPTKGDTAVSGRLVPFIELGVGFNPELSGKDNVYLNGALLGFSRNEIDVLYDKIVAFAELEDHMDVKLKNYSSGMYVRLAFSIAIRADADILLIDEVLAVGDAAFQQKCFNYFEELKRNNKTVVFVSHEMSAVRRFCNKAVYLQNGKLTAQGTASEVSEVYVKENIEDSNEETEDEDNVKSLNKIDISISIRNRTNPVIEINYEGNEKEDLYIGIAVIKDGYSLAELNTMKELKIRGSGKVIYNLDSSVFNGGSYIVRSALFKKSNRELIAVCKTPASFIVNGSDISRAAPVRLADGWKEKA